MGKYKPLLDAVKLKGGEVFATKSEIIGILAYNLGELTVSEAKKLIEDAMEEGIIEETPDGLIVHVDLIQDEEQKKDILGEMVEYIAKNLGISEIEVLEEIEKLRNRYGNLDKRILAYLYGLEKGLDMARFKDELEG
nr:UPF0175 family protein [Pyrococcus sp. ST04]